MGRKKTTMLSLMTLICLLFLTVTLVAGCTPVAETVAETTATEETVAEETVAEEPAVDEAASEEPVENKSGKIVIGYAPQVYDPTDYYGQFDLGFRMKADELGLEYEWVGRAPLTPTDYLGHNQIIEDFVTLGVDYIVAGTADPYNIITSLQSANEAGIPVVIINRLEPMDEEDVDILTYTGYAHRYGAEVAANWVLDKGLVADGDEIAIIYSLPGDYIGDERGLPFKEIMENAGVEVVYEAYSEWLREKAYEQTERMLTTFPNLKLIYGVASHPAGGAAEAVAAAGLSDQIDVIGYGAITAELDQIWEGILTATVFRDAQSNGNQAAEAIKLHLDGKEVPKQYDMNLVMVDLESMFEIVPIEQLKLCSNWAEMEQELKNLGMISE